MKAATSASTFKSRYNQTTAANKAIVNAILINSPMKKVIGLTDSDFCAAENKRSANKPFGTTQHNPPNNAEYSAGIPAIKPAIILAITVVASCMRTTGSIRVQMVQPWTILRSSLADWCEY